MFVSFPCRCSGGVLGRYPLLLQLLLRVPQCSGIKPSACWSSPGCFQDHCSATMWNHKAACCLSVAAVAVRAFCLLAYKGLAQGLVDPRCCQEHPVTCWNCTWTCVGQCCYLTFYVYIYIYMCDMYIYIYNYIYIYIIYTYDIYLHVWYWCFTTKITKMSLRVWDFTTNIGDSTDLKRMM